MSASSSRIEEAALRTVMPRLEADGYQVFLLPSPQMLPSFLSGYRPDAIAVRPDKKIALEVVGETRDDDKRQDRAQRLQSLFAGHPEWELRLIYVRDLVRDEIIPVSSRDAIEAHLARVEAAYDAMGPTAALLTAWAAFEAAARSLAPDVFGRPQATPRLIEGLAGGGYVTPNEADAPRQLSRTRSQIAHGRLDLTPTKEQVDSLIRITREMLRETA